MIIKEKYWYELFKAGVLIKAINGGWEIISGFVLFSVSGAALNKTIFFLFKGELIENPQDKLTHFLDTQFQLFSLRARDCTAIYLIIEGLINIFLAYNLYKNRLWSYTISITFGIISFFYFTYLISQTHSLLLIGFIVYDIIFTTVTWHEYKYRKIFLIYK